MSTAQATVSGARTDLARRQLRVTALTMAATLASYGSVLALERAEGLGVGPLVLAVVLALTLSRHYHARDAREWLLGLALLALLAVAASEVGSLLARSSDIGDALFVLAISASIWIRRFGPSFARAGTLVALPFVALLVAPAVPGATHEHLLWGAVVGAIAYFWVSLTQTIGERTRFVAPAAARHRAPASTGGRRVAPSSRMALQMGASLALAFVLGRWLFAQHWSWVVMTAFVVSSGNRGRGDVVYKSGLRIIGAAAGTVAATFLSGALAPRDAATVVVIFVVLGVATWLRSFSYAYWAAAITSVLSLLYGYFGESGARYLPDRLEGIAVGAAIAVAVAWLVMPVRTAEVLRRRLADVLAALSDVLAALGGEQPELASRAERFEHALAALEEVAKPVEVHRLLTRAWRHGGHIADAIDGARGCREPVAGIVALAARSPDELANPEVERHRRRAASRVGAARRALAGRRLESDVSSKPADQPPPPASSPLVAALTQLEAPMARIEGHYTAGSR